MTEHFLPLREVLHRVSLSRSCVYRLIADRKFPKPVPLGSTRKAFLESEVEAWMSARVDEREAA